MKEPKEPKQHIGFKILAYFYELLFLIGLIWIIVNCTKKNNWEQDVLMGLILILISCGCIWLIHSLNHKENKK